MIVTHCVLKCVHHYCYAQDGVGSIVCEMFAHILMVFSRITITTLLIAFAFGWQVIYENTVEIKKRIQYVYLFVLALSAYDDYKLGEWMEAHPADLFHLMQSSIQWTFYMTKMAEYALFAFATWRSLRVNRQKLVQEELAREADQAADPRQLSQRAEIDQNLHRLREQFFRQFFVCGSLFFLSTPASTLLCQRAIQESNQQMFQTLSITLAQLLVYFYIMHMLTSKQSKYYAATFRNQSILPGKIE
mmetsp:Transcript_1820/g.3194  ORF Transcript_1820/g.3194 Transcript_1820/m.3194 type:complete len:246 (-) Transcript_1820:11-748(-)